MADGTLQLTFLGSGTSHGVPMIGCSCGVCMSSDGRDKRTRACVTIAVNGATLLVDVPPDFRQQALRERLGRVDGILMTHPHADHIFGMDDVRAYCAAQKQTIPVYGDKHTVKLIEHCFGYAFEDKQGLQGYMIPRLALNEMPARAEIAGVEAIAVPIRHGSRTILGYRVGSVAYLTDCSGVPEASLELLRNLDTLIVGAIRHEPHPKHFTVAQALDLIVRLNPRRAFLTHISHRLGHAATDAELPPQVRLAYDGLRIEAPYVALNERTNTEQ